MTPQSGRDHAVLAAIVVCSLVPVLGGALRVIELLGGPSVAPASPRASEMPLPVVLHILSSGVFCLLGGIQIVPGWRRSAPRWHRRAGAVVACSGVISAATGLWMTLVFQFPPDLQGALLMRVRVVLSLGMLGLIGYAIHRIRHGDVRAHGAAMLRAYAIGQGASTQAVLGIAFLLTTGAEATGIARETLMLSAWVLNLGLAHAVIRRTAPPRPAPFRPRSPKHPPSRPIADAVPRPRVTNERTSPCPR